LDDKTPSVRQAAVRLAEPYLQESANFLHKSVVSLLEDSDPQVVIQAMLSLKQGGSPDGQSLAKQTAAATNSKGIYAINEQLWKESGEDPYLMTLLGTEGLKSYRSGKMFYNSLCYACHGPDGQGTPAGEGKTLAPPLFESPRVIGSKEASINIILHGLQGLVDDVDYGAPMISMASYSDEKLADVLTYIRNSFGNRSDTVHAQDISDARSNYAGRVDAWTIEELESEIPVIAIPNKRFENRSSWRITASHGIETTALATDDILDAGYFTSTNPYVGMWFQIELPEESSIKKIVLDAAGSESGFPLAYETHVSSDGENWSEPVASGQGEPITQIHLSQTTQAKFIRITMTEKNGWTAWFINNLEIYGDE
ncbi:MAG: discoidin domain-containing protein, partial [Opitutaceae bacterium]|nr:discoidin domain-containing protein [Opitutaceae bacterium]